MKSIIFLTLIFILLIVFHGCNENTDPILAQDIIVVQAYLYANEPITDIRLTRTLALDVDSEADPEPVNDAVVSLIKNDEIYFLEPSPGDSGYYHYSGNDISVNESELFRIEIEHGDKNIYAETFVPEAPQGVSISSTIATVPNREEIFQGGIDMNDLIITVTWNNDAESLFYVTVENIEDNPIVVNETGDGFMRKGAFQRRMVFRPTRNNEFRISPMQFKYYGKHLVKVYHVNHEYADLFDSQQRFL